MTIGSLFSGIGGLELGLERAGLGPVLWQAEISPFCRRVLRARFPGTRLFGSVQEVKHGTAARVEVLCGGFPCQPVSYAGAQLGTGDPRWLWPECTRVIRETEPRWCVFENVPGLRTNGLDVVLSGLADLGLDAEWIDLRASDVGASHRRARIVIVAHRDGRRLDRYRAAVERQVALAHRHGQRLETVSGDDRCEAVKGPADGGGCFPPRPHDTAGWREWIARGLPEPVVRGGADGVPDRVERLAALGNAVVPLVAEVVGRAIAEADAAEGGAR